MGDSTERTSRLSLAGLRENYQLGELSEENCRTNPLEQFEDWFKQAQAADLKEPNAMVLATATAEGRPSARVVLLKEVCDIGFVFYTSHASRKGQRIRNEPILRSDVLLGRVGAPGSRGRSGAAYTPLSRRGIFPFKAEG